VSDESDAFFISSACLVILITLIRLTWNTSEQSLFSRASCTVVVHNVPNVLPRDVASFSDASASVSPWVSLSVATSRLAWKSS